MKHLLHPKRWLGIFDLLLIPGLFAVRAISGQMLAHPSPCPWTRFGGQCVTCGGTHFVRALLGGRIAAAFRFNPFLFALTVFLLVAFLLLHAACFFGFKPAERVLQRLFSFPSLIVWLAAMLLFLLARNLPLLIALWQRIF